MKNSHLSIGSVNPAMTIVEEGGVVGEMPHIEGTRITVHHIVRVWLDRELTVEAIADEVYPHLSEGQVREALEWVLRNPVEYSECLEVYEERKRQLMKQVAEQWEGISQEMDHADSADENYDPTNALEENQDAEDL